MTTSQHTGQYNIQSYWGPRGETPEVIAARYIKMVESFEKIDPVFTPWFFLGAKDLMPFDQARAKLPALMAKGTDDEWGPAEGYRVGGTNSRKFHPRSLDLSGQAGSRMPPIGYGNSIHLETVSPRDHPTDATIVTYDIFQGAMMAIIEAWDVTWCAAYPTDLMDFWPHPGSGHHFRLAWMTYVSPRFAPLIRPPQGIETQSTAEGGILMVATRDRFEVTNPAHMAAARAIDDAMAPLNALPWPPETSLRLVSSR